MSSREDRFSAGRASRADVDLRQQEMTMRPPACLEQWRMHSKAVHGGGPQLKGDGARIGADE